MLRRIFVCTAVMLMVLVTPVHAAPPAPDVTYVRTGQDCIGSATGGKQVRDAPYRSHLEEAHRFATGKGVKVAVIDTGVAEHPRLKGRLEGGGDYVDKSNGTVDCDGHGTEVAGVLAASDEGGFSGAAPEATILSIRQSSDRYEFKGTPPRKKAGTVQTLAQAIVHAASSGADVINISVTNCEKPHALSDNDLQLQSAIRFAVDTENAVVVTAAGNLGPTGCSEQNDNYDPENVKVVATPPRFAEDVLSVASINNEGVVSQFSVWGPWVSLAGPGEGIVTLDPAGTGLTDAVVDPESGKPQPIVGTSFASPYVAGVAALVRERFPELNARQVMARLKATAQHPGNIDGRDHKVGHGMVNPVAALTAVIPAEQRGVVPVQPKTMLTVVNPPPAKNWGPILWALGGTGAGFVLLLLTLFVVHTVKRRSVASGS